MKKTSLILTVFAAILITGCASESSNSDTKKSSPENEKEQVVEDTIPRVTGIGGIFFVSENPDSLNQWYGENLGMAMDPYGAPFESRNANNPEEINYLRWSTHGSNAYFQPSKKEFMINYRVNNIEGMIRKLEASGTIMLDSLATYDYGKFIHFMDPEGNKVELWEPVDEVLTEMGGETTK